MPSPTPDERLAEQADLTEQIFRECKTALADLDNEPLKGNNTMNAIAKFEALVEEFKTRGMTHSQATREVVVKDPALHASYLREYNALHGRVVG